VSVVGKNVSQPIGFTATATGLYTLTIQETGLPSGTSWSVLINGTKSSSVTSAISVQLANGTYGVVVNGVPGFRADTYVFSVQISGGGVSKTITWSIVTYSVSFSEAGLSKGSTWAVTLGGSLLSSTSSLIAFAEVNGSYNFTIGSVAGYTATPSTGSVKVQGQNTTDSILFTAQPGGTGASSGLSALETGILIAVVALLAAAGAIAYLLRRRRRNAPPQSATNGTPPESQWSEKP